MATISVGNIKFNWKGPWSGSTTYSVDDVVSHSGNSYIAIQAGSNQNPSSATAYWQQMAQKGNDGTDADLAAISGTVQGDLYYNNGSAIARLAPGSASQVLQSGGAGANPSWGTVSSDFVKLAEINQTSAVGSIAMQQFITSTYKHYKVILNNVVHAAASNQTQMRMLTGTNSQYSSNNYYGAGNGYYAQYAGGSGSSHDQFSTFGVNYFRFTPGFNPGDDWGSMYIMDLYVEAGKNPMMVANSITPRHSNQYLFQGTSAMVINDTSTTFTGLLMYPSGGTNITNANIFIYGLKD